MDRADWREFQRQFPHTYTSLEHLVMAMADYANSRGKKTFFGKDKSLARYKKFEDKFKDTCLALALDGVIKRNAAPSDVRVALIEAISFFAECYPNWRDAYEYAAEILEDVEGAEDRIRRAMR